MTSGNSPVLKTSFEAESCHEAFYTGGKVQASAAGSPLYCQCGCTVTVVDVEHGTAQHTYGQEEDGEVTCFALSPDEKILVLALQNQLLKQWDTDSKVVTRTWKGIHTGPVSCMTFDPTSTLLATGGADSTIKVWDVIQQYCTHNLRGHSGVISVVAFRSETLHLISAGADSEVRVWDLTTSVCLALLDGHYSAVTSLQLGPEDLLYSGSRDKVVHVWDLKTFKRTKTVPVYESIEALILLPESGDFADIGVKTEDPHFITAGEKGELRVWNAHTSKCVFRQQVEKCPEDGSTERSGESTDGSTVLAAGREIVDVLYSLSTQTLSVVYADHNISLVRAGDFSSQKQLVGCVGEVLAMQLLGPEESHLAVATNSPLLKVYDLATWGATVLAGHSDTVLGLASGDGGRLLASSSKDKSIRVWRMCPDTFSLRCVAVAWGHTHIVPGVGFSRLAPTFIASASEDLTLKVWPLNLGAEGDNTTTVTTATRLTAKCTEKAHDKDINSVAVAPNDKLIATGSLDRTAKLWRSSDLKLMGVFRGHSRGVWGVQFSSIDQCLATSSSDGTLKIWALSDFTCVKTFEGHDCLVLNIQFVTRGMQLLTSGADGLLKLWTVKSSECVGTFDRHEDRIWAMAVKSDGDTVITGAADSRIVVWKNVTELKIEESRAQMEKFLLSEQKLMNLIAEKKFLKAIALAITLDQPFRVLGIMKDLLGEPDGKEEVQKMLLKLRPDQIDAVLKFCVQWNTNSRHCHVAQLVLTALTSSHAPEELTGLPGARGALEGMLPYTERHYQRLSRLLQQATFVEYTWQTCRMASTPAVLGELEETRDTEESAVTDHSSGDTLEDMVSAEPQSPTSSAKRKPKSPKSAERRIKRQKAAS